MIGGLYAGIVTPTEGGAAGALLAVVIGLVQRKLSWAGFVDSFKDAVGTTSQLFFVGIGAVIYTKFLALAGTRRDVHAADRLLGCRSRCCS